MIARFRLESVSSILMNNPASMVAPKAEVGRKKNPTPEEDARASAYVGQDGVLYIPAQNVRAAIIGNKGSASGKRIGKKPAPAIAAASIFVPDGFELLPLFNKKTGEPITEWGIDTRRCVIQRMAVMKSRARVDDWATEVVFDIDDSMMTPDMVLTLLKDAGKYPGIMDFRPGTRGTFGRFTAELVTEPAKAVAPEKKTRRGS